MSKIAKRVIAPNFYEKFDQKNLFKKKHDQKQGM